MSGASLPATKGRRLHPACPPTSGGRSSTNGRRPWLRRSPRAFARLERDLVTPFSYRLVHNHLPLGCAGALRRVRRWAARRGRDEGGLRAPALCSAFADQRRIVAGDADGRMRSRSAHSTTNPLRTGLLIATFRRAAPARGGAFADGRAYRCLRGRRLSGNETLNLVGLCGLADGLFSRSGGPQRVEAPTVRFGRRSAANLQSRASMSTASG
jgi:hypothetical protein